MDDAHDDLTAGVAAGIEAATGAWRFIERFAATYAHPLGEGDGCDENELRDAESRLGFALPPALRTLYGLVGRRDDLTRVQDRLLRPAELRVDDTGSALVFRVDCRADAEWGVALSTVTGKDPPVGVRPLRPSRGESTWRPFLARFSWAAIELVLSEWVMVGRNGANKETDAAAVAELERRYRRLPIPDHPQWTEPDGPPMRWFSGPDAVLWDNGGEYLWVRARTADALVAVQEALPGEWISNE